MLQVELKINGNMIGYISITNIENYVGRNVHASYSDKCEYAVDYISKDGHEHCAVQHSRSDGALVLVKKSIYGLLKNKELTDGKDKSSPLQA